MQRRQRIVFGGMPGGQVQQEEIKGPNDDPTYLHNTMVFEIGANWPFVQDLMKRFHTRELKNVDLLERDWLTFILENHIEMHKYEDSDQFIDANFKENKA